MNRRTLTPLLVAVLAVPGIACDLERTPEDPAAEQTRTDQNETTQATIFPNAPSSAVRTAVRGAALEVEEGEATFYADQFEGRRTASGRAFRQAEMVAAHRAFPFGTRLRVTNTRNDRSVEVTVVDRGPFGAGGEMAPVLDLSRAAAERLDYIGEGRARVRVEVLEWG